MGRVVGTGWYNKYCCIRIIPHRPLSRVNLFIDFCQDLSLMSFPVFNILIHCPENEGRYVLQLAGLDHGLYLCKAMLRHPIGFNDFQVCPFFPAVFGVHKGCLILIQIDTLLAQSLVYTSIVGGPQNTPGLSNIKNARPQTSYPRPSIHTSSYGLSTYSRLAHHSLFERIIS